MTSVDDPQGHHPAPRHGQGGGQGRRLGRHSHQGHRVQVRPRRAHHHGGHTAQGPDSRWADGDGHRRQPGGHNTVPSTSGRNAGDHSQDDRHHQADGQDPGPRRRGKVAVKVADSGGTATRATGFQFTPPAPTIGSLTPAKGLTAGGLTVTVTGTHLVATTLAVELRGDPGDHEPRSPQGRPSSR